MITDITGIVLIPGNGGANCPGNGAHIDPNGNLIACCCDECDYMLCCCGADQQETDETDIKF